MQKLFAKILNIQKKAEAIKRDIENPYFKSMYFDINSLLDEIKPLLNDEGLVVIQPLTTGWSGKASITTTVFDVESGETQSFETVLPENPDPQKMGAIITYYRRYSLTSLFLLQAEDNDANDSMVKKEIPNVKAYSKPALTGIADRSVEDVTNEEACPQCSAGFLKTKKGPYGSFVGCSTYPNCKFRK